MGVFRFGKQVGAPLRASLLSCFAYELILGRNPPVGLWLLCDQVLLVAGESFLSRGMTPGFLMGIELAGGELAHPVANSP